jgi:hypothetical protein
MKLESGCNVRQWIKCVLVLGLSVGVASAQKARYSESHRPDPLLYPLIVHVTHARVQGAGSAGVLHLDAIIDNKKVELEANAAALLHVGDYQARVLAEDHKKSGWFSKSYELLFSDGTTVTFAEVAESE